MKGILFFVENKMRTFEPWEGYMEKRKDYPPWMFLSKEKYEGLIEELQRAYKRIYELEEKHRTP